MSKELKKIGAKVKDIPKDITKPKEWLNIAIQITIGFVVGVLVDIFLEAIVHQVVKELGGRLEVGVPLYYTHPDVTSIAYDDALLIVISVLTIFAKKIWFTIGFSLGWYLSSCHDFYGILRFPKTPIG